MMGYQDMDYLGKIEPGAFMKGKIKPQKLKEGKIS
jgi:hypothetical protein